MMLKNLAGLIKVKTIVTLFVVAIWGILALRGVITSDLVNGLALIIIGFYFGTQKAREGEDKE